MARVTAGKIYDLTKGFPQEERFGLVNQLRRAGVSVMSNLAEGSGRTNAKDQAHFSQLAYGSLMEIDAQLQLSVDLNFLTKTAYLDVRPTIEELSAAINALRAAQLKRIK
ncbi:MAG TPA: four helix bundle protein [Deltaproteobacteria bacterium]|nr:four helix bundle protein [Deltaproteobacteria bacterium]